MNHINEQPFDDGVAAREVGTECFQEIKDLRRHLYGDEGPPEGGWICRFAPSIIARGEVEIFGRSVPRFALRVYLDADRQAFVNVRRLAVLCGQNPQWSKRIASWRRRRSDFVPAGPSQKSAVEVLKNCSCVADCLLVVDANRFGQYHVIQSPLCRIYGEVVGSANDRQAEVLGIPFLRHMRLSGGLCAQAACFMATVLLHHDVEGVHGVADITVIAQPELLDEIPLTGLNGTQMAHYFSDTRVGLSAVWQHPVPRTPPLRGGDPALPQIESLAHSLRAYVRSNMPVLLPVDQRRMNDDTPPKEELRLTTMSIYERNRVQHPHLKREDDATPARHVVLVLGADGQREFLVNDTACLPLMEASARQLFEARCYDPKSLEVLDEPLFLPVTPSTARLLLEDWTQYADKPERRQRSLTRYKPGLIHIAETIQFAEPFAPGVPHVPSRCFPGEFRLVKGPFGDDVDIPDPGLVPQQAWQPLTRFLCDAVVGRPRDQRWFWLQYATDRYTGGSIWVWDAGAPPPSSDVELTERETLVRRYLVGVLASSQTQWQVAWRRPAPGSETAPLPVPTPATSPNALCLAPSLISSFSVLRGTAGAVDDWPKNLACDIYTFMNTDALLDSWQPTSSSEEAMVPEPRLRYWQRLLRSLGHRQDPAGPRAGAGPRSETVVDRLAVWLDHPDALDEVGRQLQGVLAAAVPPIRCIGFTTFMPEAAAGGDEARQAERALRSLMRLARSLNPYASASTRPFTIELVGGSAIRGVWPARLRKPDPLLPKNLLVANRPRYVQESFGSLLDVLSRLAEEARQTNVQFSLELEPGELFLLRNQNDLDRLCRALRRHTLSPVLGLNLDVAHWSLAGLTPEIVERTHEVCERITHVHISSSGNGHFGDLCLGETGRPQELLDWLVVANKIARDAPLRDKGLPRFSGFVSLELEAVKCKAMVVLSAARLQYLLECVTRGEANLDTWPTSLVGIRSSGVCTCQDCGTPCL